MCVHRNVPLPYIKVESRPESGSLVDVRDQGKGFSPDRVFEASAVRRIQVPQFCVGEEDGSLYSRS